MIFWSKTLVFFTFTISAMHITFNVHDGNANRSRLHLYGICHALRYTCINIPVSRPLIRKRVLSIARYTKILVVSRELL